MRCVTTLYEMNETFTVYIRRVLHERSFSPAFENQLMNALCFSRPCSTFLYDPLVWLRTPRRRVCARILGTRSRSSLTPRQSFARFVLALAQVRVASYSCARSALGSRWSRDLVGEYRGSIRRDFPVAEPPVQRIASGIVDVLRVGRLHGDEVLAKTGGVDTKSCLSMRVFSQANSRNTPSVLAYPGLVCSIHTSEISIQLSTITYSATNRLYIVRALYVLTRRTRGRYGPRKHASHHTVGPRMEPSPRACSLIMHTCSMGHPKFGDKMSTLTARDEWRT